MNDVLENFKGWFKQHPNAKKGLIIAAIVIVLFSLVRVIVINLPQNEEQEQDPLAGVELSNEQDKIISKYSDDDKKLVDLLKSNKWVSQQKTSSCEFNDKQIIERRGDTENTQTYAVCGIEKDNEDTEFHEEVYKFTVLAGDGKYKQAELHIRREGSLNSSAIETVYVKGENLFKNADGYERVIPPDVIEIENWDDSVNSLIGNKQGEMRQKIKEYLYLYYPQIGMVSWNGIAGINYYTHVVSLNFTILLTSSTTSFIVAEYNKDTGDLRVGMASSADSMNIKKGV